MIKLLWTLWRGGCHRQWKCVITIILGHFSTKREEDLLQLLLLFTSTILINNFNNEGSVYVIWGRNKNNQVVYLVRKKTGLLFQIKLRSLCLCITLANSSKYFDLLSSKCKEIKSLLKYKQIARIPGRRETTRIILLLIPHLILLS